MKVEVGGTTNGTQYSASATLDLNGLTSIAGKKSTTNNNVTNSDVYSLNINTAVIGFAYAFGPYIAPYIEQFVEAFGQGKPYPPQLPLPN